MLNESALAIDRAALPTPASIVIIGDRSPDILRTVQALEPFGDVRLVTGDEAAAVLFQLEPDLVVVDDREEARVSGLLEDVGTRRPAPVRIILGGRALAADPQGAVAVLPKPVDPVVARTLCALGLRCAAAQHSAYELEHEADRLRRPDTAPSTSGPLEEGTDVECYEGILTRSPAIKRVVTLLQKIEGSEATVFIRGETGSGKELVARAIHARGRRRRERFVVVNLGAVPEHLRERTLFGESGHGAGADGDGRGLFAEAHGGCLFIDEIGDASPALQVSLLRVLEEGTITAVGSDRPRRVDVRILSGCTRDLEELVRQGLFRRDLYYRLNVFPIELPPLRERGEDIFPLANHFLALASRAVGKQTPGISREARAVLEAYRWEGNVLELRNVMERAAILCKGGLVIAADLPMGAERRVANGAPSTAGAQIAIPPGGASLQQLEREIFEKTLALMGGNQSRAARALGLCESTFRFRLRKLGIASRRATDTQRAPESQPTADS